MFHIWVDCPFNRKPTIKLHYLPNNTAKEMCRSVCGSDASAISASLITEISVFTIATSTQKEGK